MTPSASRPMIAACSGVLMPKPTARGVSVWARTRLMKPARSACSPARAPVTPVTLTR